MHCIRYEKYLIYLEAETLNLKNQAIFKHEMIQNKIKINYKEKLERIEYLKEKSMIQTLLKPDKIKNKCILDQKLIQGQIMTIYLICHLPFNSREE